MPTQAPTKKTLWLIWAALLALLAATWGASRLDLGLGNTLIALLISGLKMTLVLLFFMQVRYSSKWVWIFACAGFVWWAIFITLAMTDYLTRKTVQPYSTPNAVSQNAMR